MTKYICILYTDGLSVKTVPESSGRVKMFLHGGRRGKKLWLVDWLTHGIKDGHLFSWMCNEIYKLQVFSVIVYFR